MPTDSIRVTGLVAASPERIYEAWLNSRQHSAFTGAKASVQPIVGGRHTAWDGYIEGMTLELSPGSRIVQSWRTTEFPKDSPDSRLELLLEPSESGTRVTFVHTEIPAGQGGRYEQGWVDYYLEPMRKYFEAFSRQTLVMPRPPRGPAKKRETGAAAKRDSAKASSRKPAAKKTAAKRKAPAKKKASRRPVRKTSRK